MADKNRLSSSRMGELPEGQESLSCVFRMQQREWNGQFSYAYDTEPVTIPLPE